MRRVDGVTYAAAYQQLAPPATPKADLPNALRVTRKLIRGSRQPMNKADLAQVLKETRERAGLSQAELGRRMSRPSSTISRIEAGQMDATIDTIQQWATYCDAALHLYLPRVNQPLDFILGRAASVIPAVEDSSIPLLGLLQLVEALPEEERPLLLRSLWQFMDEKQDTYFRELAPNPHFFGRILTRTVEALGAAMSTRRMWKRTQSSEAVQDAAALVAEVLALSPFPIHPKWTPEILVQHYPHSTFQSPELEALKKPPPE